MRVLVIADPHIPIPPENYGGAERIVHWLCQGLQAQGHTVRLMAGRGSKDYGGGVIVHRAPTLQYASRAYRKIRFQPESLWASFPCDVVVNFGRVDYLLSLLHLHKPLVCCFQNPISQAEIDWLAKHRRRQLQCVGISQAQIQEIESSLPFQVIYNATSVDAFQFQAVPHSPPYLAFLGRLTRNKGIDRAITVARQAGMPLKIAGTLTDEPGERSFFEQVIRPQLDDRCQWIGPVNDRQKNQLLGGATALLFPIQWDEPFGIVMAESLACGTPVIAWRRASTPEVINDGVTGFLCDSVDQMVAAVKQVNQLDRQACRRAAETRFSAEVMVKHYSQLLRDICSC